MTPEEKEIRQRLKDDLPHYAAKCLKIRAKDGAISAFTLNKAQLYIHKRLEEQKGQTGKVRALILKGRQQGCSTYVGARFYHKVTHNFGCQAFILTHSLEATNNLYIMAKRYYEHTPDLVKPAVSKSNAKELIFGTLDSGYKLGTAENKNVGRSATIQLLHWSETAFSSNTTEHSTGILQAVPNAAGTEIILESTANGIGNYFHQEWQKAESGLSEFIAIFIPWFWQDEYTEVAPEDFTLTAEEAELCEQYDLTHGQVLWRRKKIVQLSANGIDGRKSFRQEYPMCSSEAFQLTGEDSFIESSLITKCRKTKDVEAYGALLLGVDPARFGDDRTSIIRRRGRQAFGLEKYVKKSTMEVVGIVYEIIQRENPVKVFIDVGGLGAGIVDRLNELCDSGLIVSVNAGSHAFHINKYRNKKAEMWALAKEWMMDWPCQIPDDDELHADLCNIKYSYDSNSRLVMESKDDMKKRGVRSPDCAESLIQTFALPHEAILASINNGQNSVAANMALEYEKRQAIISKSRR